MESKDKAQSNDASEPRDVQAPPPLTPRRDEHQGYDSKAADGAHVDDMRPSGVPPERRLGAARNELFFLIVGAVVFVAIVVAFFFETAP